MTLTIYRTGSGGDRHVVACVDSWSEAGVEIAADREKWDDEGRYDVIQEGRERTDGIDP